MCEISPQIDSGGFFILDIIGTVCVELSFKPSATKDYFKNKTKVN